MAPTSLPSASRRRIRTPTVGIDAPGHGDRPAIGLDDGGDCIDVLDRERAFEAVETGAGPGNLPLVHQAADAGIGLVANMGESVKAAGAKAGYAAPSAFVAAFRTLFGVTPGRYFERE
jgi:AraC-like DNA-binding protein